MQGYTVSVVETSKELTGKQKIQLKDTTDCVRLDQATLEGNVIIDVDFWAELAIHNEKSDDKDYTNYVVVDKSGVRYVTGSEAFWSAFRNIFDDMSDCDEEWTLKVYRKPSKNRQGKDFITCSVL
jgi:hypothetical protein